jgi:hypothetical protein
MTPPDGMRASDAEREHHAELLREHAAQGRLSVDELSDRLDRAYGAQTRGDLAELVADLPVAPPPPPPRRDRPPSLAPHLAAYVAVNLLLIGIWAATGGGYFWPIWPLLGWGVGVVFDGGPCRMRRLHRARPRGRTRAGDTVSL